MTYVPPQDEAVKINLIAAMDRNRYIGNKGDMPWSTSMKADLKRFKELTKGKAVIMGRKTYESIGRPLPDRLNIVITRNSHYDPPELRVPFMMPMGPFKTKWSEEDKCFYSYMENKEVPYQTVSLNAQAAVDVAHLFGYKEVFVIGGAQIYQEFMPYADRIYLTKIHGNFEGDTSFPSIIGKWKYIGKEQHKADENNPYGYTFTTMEKVS